MNPYTGELRRIKADELMPAGFEQVPRELDLAARLKLDEQLGRRYYPVQAEGLSAQVNLKSQHPLALWAKKKRKAKLAAASRRRNRT